MAMSDGYLRDCNDKIGGSSECNSSLESLDLSEKQLIADLETGNMEVQTLAINKIVYIYDSKRGEYSGSDESQSHPIPSLDFMIKIQNVFHDIYYERIRIYRTDPNRKLMEEMGRFCDACRKALCSILEFLNKVKEPEMLEPLMPTICACLGDIDRDVRQSALDAISTIYNNFDFLIPDYIELITRFIDGEQGRGLNCKWKAFKMQDANAAGLLSSMRRLGPSCH